MPTINQQREYEENAESKKDYLNLFEGNSDNGDNSYNETPYSLILNEVFSDLHNVHPPDTSMISPLTALSGWSSISTTGRMFLVWIIGAPPASR